MPTKLNSTGNDAAFTSASSRRTASRASARYFWPRLTGPSLRDGSIKMMASAAAAMAKAGAARPEHPVVATGLGNRLRIDLTEDAGRQEGGRHEANRR